MKTDIHAMCGGDDPLVGDDCTATPVTPVVAAVQHARLPWPGMCSSLYTTNDARVLGRDAAVTTVHVLR